MTTNKIAHAIVERIILAVDTAWEHTLNANLHEIAKENGVDLPAGANLVGWAVGIVKMLGVTGAELDALAMEAINRVVSRDSSDGELKEISKKYVQTTIIPTMVLDLKSKGYTLAEIKKDPKITHFMEKHNFRSTNIDNVFNGKTKPNKTVDISNLGLRHTKARDNIFSEFKAERGATFKSFWFTAIKNEARNIISEWNNKTHSAVSEAMSLVPERADESHHGDKTTLEENYFGHEEDRTKSEINMMAKSFRSALNKINPDYVKVINKMNDDHLDLTSKSHQKYFMDLLGLKDQAQFLRWQKTFLMDLKKVFQSLDVNHEEATQLMRAAKVALKIAQRWAVV